MADKIRVTMDVSPEFKQLLERLAENESRSQTDVIRRAIALYQYALDAKVKGKQLAVLNQDDSVAAHLVNL